MRVERLESHQPEEQKCKESPYSIKNKLYVIKPRQKKAHTKNARAKLVFNTLTYVRPFAVSRTNCVSEPNEGLDFFYQDQRKGGSGKKKMMKKN